MASSAKKRKLEEIETSSSGDFSLGPRSDSDLEDDELDDRGHRTYTSAPTSNRNLSYIEEDEHDDDLSNMNSPQETYPPLNSDDLSEILEALKASRFLETEWKELGLNLGLPFNKLQKIENDQKTTSRCLMDCLNEWLSRADEDERTWDFLADCLRRLDQNASSKKVLEIGNCLKILHKYRHELRSLNLNEIAYRMKKEGINVIVNLPVKINLQKAVYEDHKHLLTFARVLKMERHEELANNIIRDYKNLFPSNLSVTAPNTETHNSSSNTGTMEIHDPFFKTEFNNMKHHFGTLFYDIGPLIEAAIPSLDEMKRLIRSCHPDLKTNLSSSGESFDEVFSIVREKCSIIDIVLLEHIVDKYYIESDLISEYKGKLDDFGTNYLRSCYYEQLKSLPLPHLKCETIRFIVDWRPETTTLADIKRLIQNAFKDLATKVEIIFLKEGSSIIIICFFPHHLMDLLLVEANDNIGVLKEMGLLLLTIGYITVYDIKKVDVCELEPAIHDLSIDDEEPIAEQVEMEEGNVMDPEKILLKKTLEEKDQKIKEQDLHIKKTTRKWQDKYKELDRSKEEFIKLKDQQIQELLKDKELMLEELQKFRSKDAALPTSQDMYLLLKLETTGLPKQGQYPDICQIATLEMNSEEEWNCYIIPEKEIKPSAAELNKFEVHISEKGERTLTQNGQKVPAKDYAVGLQDFYDYLRKKSIDHRKVHPNGNVILVAHNCMNFDAPILLNAFVKMNITSAQDLLNMGVFFVDTYKILQIAKPSFLEGHSLSLPHLCEEFFHEKFPDDNAQEKLLVLRKVLNDSDFGFTTLSKLSFYKFSPQPLLDF
jgi:hypothetical protein